MTINHAITIPSRENVPHPSGTPSDSGQESPTPENPWRCSFPCTIEGHTDTVTLLWDGQSFSLPDAESNDPNFGTVSFTYAPPLQ